MKYKNTFWGSLSHLGINYGPHPSGFGRMNAAVNIFDFVCPYKCFLYYYTFFYAIWNIPPFRKH